MSVNWVEGRRALLKVNGTWESAIACYDDAPLPQAQWVPLISGDDDGVLDVYATTAPDPEACPLCGEVSDCDKWCRKAEILEKVAPEIIADWAEYVWAPPLDAGGGCYTAAHLRIIADELDRRTESEDG